MSPLFREKKGASKFKQLISKFWSIAKETDASTVDTFDGEWDALCLLLDEVNNSAAKDKGILWLEQLKMKKEAWAQRYVCRHLTYLVYSTQRAEAVHAGIKQKVIFAKMKMTQILEGLTQYNKQARDIRATDAVRLMLKQAASAHELPPFVDCLRTRVTPYAFDLIKAQASRALGYTASLLQDDTHVEDVYEKRYNITIAGRSMTRANVQLTDDGELQVSAADTIEDLGLQDFTSSTGRTCTLKWCSCQWDTSSGLDLCAHRIKLMTVLGDQLPPDSLQPIGARIANKWLKLSCEEEVERIQILQSTQVWNEGLSASAYTNGSSSASLTNQERRQLMMIEMRNLANIACVSQLYTDKVMQGMKELNEWLLHPHDSRSNQQATTRVPQSTGASNRASHTNFEKRGDYKNLCKALGSQFEVVPAHEIPNNDDLGDLRTVFDETNTAVNTARPFEDIWYPDAIMVGREIAFKWNGSGIGGWHVGKIKQYFLPSQREHITFTFGRLCANFKVFFYTDEKEANLPLHVSNYCRVPEEDTLKGNWLLLKQKALSNDQAVHLARQQALHPPLAPAQKERGRPRAQRFRPAFGPTS